MPDPLDALLLLRRLALDEAKRALASALEAEDGAAGAVSAAEMEIAHETRSAEAALDQGDAQVEAFARWLRVARGRLAKLRLSYERAGAETARARAALTAARAAHEAAVLARQERADAATARRLAEEQAELDEAAQRRDPP
jgi:flagellar export protein FliJ